MTFVTCMMAVPLAALAQRGSGRIRMAAVQVDNHYPHDLPAKQLFGMQASRVRHRNGVSTARVFGNLLLASNAFAARSSINLAQWRSPFRSSGAWMSPDENSSGDRFLLGASESQKKADSFASGESTGSFEDTSFGVRGLVSSLTGLVNLIFSFLGKDDVNAGSAMRELAPLSLQELLDGVRADYVERMYLWTGDIDPDLYDEDCVFTDPTLSFRGLATFQRNLANLQPILKALVKDPGIDLFSCELDTVSNQVQATWRMRADISLPWNPAIDLVGRTTFTYDPEKGNHIIDYREDWETKAGAVLMQLVRPKAQR